MLEFQEKRKIKKIFYSKITLIVLLAVIALLLNGVWNVYKKEGMSGDNLAKSAASLESLRVREKMLSSEIERLETKAGVEEEIRSKYGLVKPGEEVIMIVDNEDKDLKSKTASPGLWQRIAEWFR